MNMLFAMILAAATQDCQYSVGYGLEASKFIDGTWLPVPEGSFVPPGVPVRFRGWGSVGPGGCDACCADISFNYATSPGTCQPVWTSHWQYVGVMPTIGAGQTWDWISPTYIPETYIVLGQFLIDEVQSGGQSEIYQPSRAFFVPCSGDVTGDLTVNVADLLTVINGWVTPPTSSCPDANHDGVVNVADFLIVLNNWGSCN